MTRGRRDHASQRERSRFLVRPCEGCAVPVRPWHLYCSDRCRARGNRAKRARERAEELARLRRLAGLTEAT